MPPSVASLLCVGYIAWLLYRDWQRSPRTAIGLWIPTLWVAIMASKPVYYWFNGNSVELSIDMYLDGNPIDRAILLVLLALGALILLKRGVDWGEFFSSNRVLLLFYAYLAMSVLWSEYPFVAFKRYIKDIGNILMILVIITDKRPAEAIRQVLVRCAFVLVPLSVLFIKYYPDIGRYYHRWTYETMYSGVTTNKNSLGLLAMISGLFVLWSLLEAQKKQPLTVRIPILMGQGAVLVMCVWLMQIADSATSKACFAVGCATIFGSRVHSIRNSPRLVTWGMFTVLVLSFVFLVVPAARALVASSVGRDPSLTTRTDIWAAAMDLNTNPLVGAGYASVWLTTAGTKLALEFKIPHVHNGYLETYLNTGLIGATLLVLLLLHAGRKAAKSLSEDSTLAGLPMALFLPGVIYNYTEVTFNINNIVCFSLWLIAINGTVARSVTSAAKVAVAIPPGTRTRPIVSAAGGRHKGVGQLAGSRPPMAGREPRMTWNR